MPQRILIYGGSGGLGSVLVKYFKDRDWWVCSVDTVANPNATHSVTIKKSIDDTLKKQEEKVIQEVGKLLGRDTLEAIINMAGGWAGGNASSEDLIPNAERMWKQSVWSSIISAVLASRFLSSGGCIMLPGAKHALIGTPEMIGYGMAKAAVHQLAKSLALPKSGLPDNAACLALLPVTLDTPMNRRIMPNANHSSWTSLEFVAKLLFKWANNQERPASGSLVQMITKDGETTLKTE